jgi:hypothetical protein
MSHAIVLFQRRGVEHYDEDGLRVSQERGTSHVPAMRSGRLRGARNICTVQ